MRYLYSFLLGLMITTNLLADNYKIIGTVDAPAGTCIHILGHGNFIQGESNWLVDSTHVENGRFEYSGNIDGDASYFVSYSDKAVDFIAEKGTIYIDMTTGKITGTPANEAFGQYRSQNDEIWKSVREKYEEANEKEKLEILADARKKDFQLSKEYVQNYSKSVLADIVIYNFQESSCDEFDALLQIRGDHPFRYRPLIGKKFRNDKKRRTEAGQKFLDFTIEKGNLDGTTVKLSDYVGRGKYVLVDFWASWCGWCIKEFPVLREVYQKHKGDNFEMVGVMVQDRIEASKRAIEKEKPEWPQIINAQKVPMELYGIGGIPEIILFAPDGTIIERGLRGQHLKDVVDENLKK